MVNSLYGNQQYTIFYVFEYGTESDAESSAEFDGKQYFLEEAKSCS